MRTFLAAQGMFPRKISFGADSLTGMNGSVLVAPCPDVTGEDTAAPLDDPCLVGVDTVFLGVDTTLVQTDTFDLIGLDIVVFK